MTPSIAIIGAGSAVFSLALIRDLCLTERLHGCEVRLMDIDAARLQAITRLCERYSAEMGAGIRAAATTDRRAALDETRPVSEAFPPERSGEVMVPLIKSIACDIPRTLIGNVLNRGDYVPGIPRDFAVEIPLQVSKRGIAGIQTRGLPEAVLAQIWKDRVAPVTMELAAYDEGSRERLVELVLADPWPRSLEQAEALVDEILAMPGHGEMRKHYGGWRVAGDG